VTEIVNAFVDADEEHVVLLHRAGDGSLQSHRVPADYCVYFRREDVPPELRRAWRRDPLCRGYRDEGDWTRTRWRGWQARRELVRRMVDEGVATFEGDCSPVKRWMADHPDATIQRPRRCYLDLETDSRVRIGDAKRDGARILVWCVTDEAGGHQEGCLEVDTDAAERALLKDLYRALAPFDQVCAWNGDDFDFPILKLRTRDRRIEPGILKRWLKMDHMVLYKRLNLQVAESGEEKQSFALQAVATAQLGEGKDDFDARHTYEEWAASGPRRERLVRYCARDTDLLRRIEAKTGYLKLHQTVAEVCGLFADSWALLPTAQMDAFLLRLGHRRGVHFPTVLRDEGEEVHVQYKGSYNKDPPTNAGILRNVHVMDFASMYPSIMISWNMSWETRCDGPVNGPLPPGMCRAPKTGICFDTTRVGLIPEALEHFLAKRKEMSALRASLSPGTPEAHDAERWTNAYKVVPNSFYGAQGSPGSRFHNRGVAESISQTGAWLAQKTEAALEERYGILILYVDTDGLWTAPGVERARVEEAVAWLNGEYYPKLLRDCGCEKNIVKIAYEKEFDRLVFCGPKNYTGRYVHFKGTPAVEGAKPEIKGIAYKRGDSTKLTRELQAEVIDLLMGGMRVAAEPGPTEDIARFEEAVGRWRERILGGELAVEDIQTVKGLSKALDEYAQKKSTKGTDSAQPPHVRVAKMLAARGEYVGEGTKIAYVVTDADASPQAVIPACDYDGTCDRRYLWGRIWTPTEQLLENAFPQHPWSKKFGPPPKPKKGAPRAGQEALF
jgi:DNA polymerase elongation subunit (family B)